MDGAIEYLTKQYYLELSIAVVATIGLMIGLIKTIIKIIHEVGISTGYKVLVIVITGFFIFATWTTITYLRDFKYVKNKEFYKITGMVDNIDARNEGGPTVNFVDIDTGEQIELQVPGNKVEKGEVYEVIYLPHIRHGCYVKKLK